MERNQRLTLEQLELGRLLWSLATTVYQQLYPTEHSIIYDKCMVKSVYYMEQSEFTDFVDLPLGILTFI